MGTYTSDELFHIVGRRHCADDEGNYQILRTILLQNCVSHPPHIRDYGRVGYTISWDKGLLSEELFIPMVICFCDIPFAHLGIHCAKYGRFGLSFSKRFLASLGARPVIYYPYDPSNWLGHGFSNLRDIESTYRGFWQQLDEKLDHSKTYPRSMGKIPSSPEEATRAVSSMLGLEFMSFIKPFDFRLPETDRNNFYMEREWRKFANLQFQPNDVISILVASGFETRLAAEMPQYATRIRPAPSS